MDDPKPWIEKKVSLLLAVGFTALSLAIAILAFGAPDSAFTNAIVAKLGKDGRGTLYIAMILFSVAALVFWTSVIYDLIAKRLEPPPPPKRKLFVPPGADS